ncbi:MAG: DUF4266 domain-containing protein [Granulosicoccus sp.]|nr:DUF4266 domain-containing protein [Granulosicoccus sp.]
MNLVSDKTRHLAAYVRRLNLKANDQHKAYLLSACVIALSGCTTVGNIMSVTEVKPWERESLSKGNMQLEADSMDSAIDDHIYFSREASTGGSGINGGGCGCN